MVGSENTKLFCASLEHFYETCIALGCTSEAFHGVGLCSLTGIEYNQLAQKIQRKLICFFLDSHFCFLLLIFSFEELTVCGVTRAVVFAQKAQDVN